tara:strand:- start:1464 stop:2024 length:561 start_codon:yes stop_codon:yes gene_type:complete
MKNERPIIGVFALQGAVDLHKPHIEAAGAEFRTVKTPAQFKEVDAFIIPGGESTTMLKLIENFDLWDVLMEEFSAKPVWGICAGSILLAQNVTNPAQKSFGLLPITIQRNGYGRQLESHHVDIMDYTVSFIRAPVITEMDAGVEVLASYEGAPVWVKKGNILASTFHPELTMQYPSPMHKYFIDLV